MIMSYITNLEMSYRETAKLSNLRGGQDGRKGHNHGSAEGTKKAVCNSQSNRRADNSDRGSKDCKELRLRGISAIDEANKFLDSHHNRKTLWRI